MEMFRFLPLRFHCTQDGPDINTGALSFEERFVITSLVLTLWLRVDPTVQRKSHLTKKQFSDIFN